MIVYRKAPNGMAMSAIPEMVPSNVITGDMVAMGVQSIAGSIS